MADEILHTDEQAAERIHEILNPPKEKKPPAAENTRAAEEGDDNPEEDEEPEGGDEQEQDDDAAEEPEPDDGESEVTVKIDGKNQKIKLRELGDGYLRTLDYRHKTQQLASERRAFESELASTRSERERYGAALGQLHQQMQALTPQEPDWVALLNSQGLEAYTRAKLGWDAAMRNRQAVEAEMNRLAEQQRSEDEQLAEKRFSEESSRMLDVIPEWKDAKTMQKERPALIEWAKKQGFSDKEIGQITDHRAVAMLRLAWIGDRMLRAKASLKPAPEPEEVRPARPLAASARRDSSGVAAAQKRLAETGDVDDMAAVFQAMEKNQRRRAS